MHRVTMSVPKAFNRLYARVLIQFNYSLPNRNTPEIFVSSAILTGFFIDLFKGTHYSASLETSVHKEANTSLQTLKVCQPSN